MRSLRALLEEMDKEEEADGSPTNVIPADRILTREDIYEDHP